MKKFTIKYLVSAVACLATLSSCNLTETQKSSADVAMIFGSETGLEAYCYDFYGLLPNTQTAYEGDEWADFLVKSSLSRQQIGSETPDTHGSWDWSDIRNVNYFLDHNTYPSVPEATRNNYSGIAKFWRAYLYFSKLRTYGEVPWIDHVLNPGDPELLASRDTRDLIVTKIIEDLDYAYENIRLDNSSSCNCNFVNKWCALLLKSRVCLFEASWRKYHAGTDLVKNCTIPADDLFALAAQAAEELILSGPFTLHTGAYAGGGNGPYRELFSSSSCPSDEVMLSVSSDEILSRGYANYYFNCQDVRPSLARPFVNTYLNRDGSYYSETKSDGKCNTFLEETSNRDLRLNQTIRAADYKRLNATGANVLTTAKFSYSLTGYQIIKYTIDDVAYDTYGANGNDLPVMRFAEALLNFAEAKAELGTLTDADWKLSIGALRRRAGITGGDLDKKPTKVDTYIQSTYFPKISDPVILEIRRERAIELCLEGFRLDDLKRWACGDLWENSLWTGIFVPALDTPLDINGDGEYDVYFEDKIQDSKYSNITIQLASPAKWLSVPGGKVINYDLKGRKWYDRMYLEPIGTDDITLNPNLAQNPGYENL